MKINVIQLPLDRLGQVQHDVEEFPIVRVQVVTLQLLPPD